MTRVSLGAKLQNHFNNDVYFTTQDLDESIQDGLDEVCAFSGCRLGTALVSFEVHKTYYDLISLVPDYIGAISIYNKVTKRWLVPTSLRKLEQTRSDWDTSYGTPEHFVPISHRWIGISRKPAVTNYGQMLLYYRTSAPVLSDGLPIPVPDEHAKTLESYCLSDLAEQAQEWTKAGLNFKSYLKSLDALRVAIQNQTNSDRQMSLR